MSVSSGADSFLRTHCRRLRALGAPAGKVLEDHYRIAAAIFRVALATIMIATPELIRFTPTISPNAQLKVPGQPAMIRPARTMSIMPLKSIHPQGSGKADRYTVAVAI